MSVGSWYLLLIHQYGAGPYWYVYVSRELVFVTYTSVGSWYLLRPRQYGAGICYVYVSIELGPHVQSLLMHKKAA